MKKRLSGWQRLCVVFCGLCLLVTAVLTVLALPSGSEYERKRLLDSIDLVLKHNAFVQRLETAGFSKAEIEEHLSKGGKIDDHSVVSHPHLVWCQLGRIWLGLVCRLGSKGISREKSVLTTASSGSPINPAPAD